MNVHIRQAYNLKNYKFAKSLDFDENCYKGVFEVAKQDFVVELSKFKIADSIWHSKIRKKLRFCLELVYRCFCGP